MTTPAPPNIDQPLLPFAESELLRVRILPAEFARSLGVHKSTVSRWIKHGTIAASADGRIDPQRAMRQLLRNGDPGRFRSRLIRQAYSDLDDLRAQADRAAQLEQQIIDQQLAATHDRERADEDYETLDTWLDAFERRIAAIPQAERAAMDGLSWRGYVKSQLIEIMRTDDELAEIGRQTDADLAQLPDLRASGENEGGRE